MQKMHLPSLFLSCEEASYAANKEKRKFVYVSQKTAQR